MSEFIGATFTSSGYRGFVEDGLVIAYDEDGEPFGAEPIEFCCYKKKKKWRVRIVYDAMTEQTVIKCFGRIGVVKYLVYLSDNMTAIDEVELYIYNKCSEIVIRSPE
jgi:hypothetical protein